MREKPKKALNAIFQNDSIDVSSRIELDLEYLYSITNQGDVLLMYHCTINGRTSIVLIDTGARNNYVLQRFAEKASLKFRDTVELQCSMSLPNGQNMKVIGQCGFMLEISE